MNEPTKIRVWPAPGMLIRRERPPHRHISKDGEEVTFTRHVRRLIAAGDLLTSPPNDATAPAPVATLEPEPTVNEDAHTAPVAEEG